jgi:pilus assembly protein CpaB
VNLTDPARVAGFVNPGDKVAIFLTGSAEGGSGYSRLLLPSVQVIGAGTTTMVASTSTDANGAPVTDQLPKTLLTVAVTQDEAERLLFATSNGELSFGLLNTDSQIAASKGITATNLFTK